MPKFTFTCTHEDILGKVKSKITHEVTSETLSDIKEDFDSFLRGCGYSLEQDLNINDDYYHFGSDVSYTPSNDWSVSLSTYDNNDVLILNTEDDTNHNSFFYDTDRNR